MRRVGTATIAIIVVVIVIIAATFAYLEVTHKISSNPLTSKPSYPPGTVTVWADFSSTEFPAFLTAVQMFEKAHPNDTVVWTNQTTPSPSNYVTAAEAGDAPDILIGTSDFAGGLYFGGFLANLSMYVNASAFAPFIPTALADVTQAGGVYGFPLNVNGVAMIYNKQLIPTAPTTTDQMLAEAQNATTFSGGKIATAGLVYAYQSDGGYRYPAWLTAFGGQMFAGNGLPDLNSTAAAEALQYVQNFSTVDNVEPTGITAETTWEGLFEKGQAAIIFDGPWDIQSYINALGAQNVGVAPMPVLSSTGLAPRPFWGSIGAYVSLPVASGANNATFNESIQFAQYLASPSVEEALFNSSGDIPSLNSTFQHVHKLGIPFVNGFLDQFFNDSQAFPNTPQMSYFWDPWNTEISDFASGSIDASAAMSAINAAIISEMQQNNIPPE